MRFPSLRAGCAAGLLALVFAIPAQAASRPDKATMSVFDLSRPRAPLALVMKLPEGMWQFGDHRKRNRIEKDAVTATSWLYSQDHGANGWLAQGYLAIHDLRAHAPGTAYGAKPAAKKPRRRRKKVVPPAFARYLGTLPERYEDAGYRITVAPHRAHPVKDLRAGRKRVEMWYADLGITRTGASRGSIHEYRVSVYGFVVNDWLVTLRVRQLGKDLASQFTDGLSLTVRRALASRDVKFTAVTTNHLETRSAFRLPKGYVRKAPGAPGTMPIQRMALWERFQEDERVGRLTLDVTNTAFEPDRDVTAWQALNPWAGNLERRKARGKRLAHTYAYGATTLDDRAAASHAIVWHVGTHRYVLRLEVRLNPGDAVNARGRREIDAMLQSLHSWLTRPLDTK